MCQLELKLLFPRQQGILRGGGAGEAAFINGDLVVFSSNSSTKVDDALLEVSLSRLSKRNCFFLR